MKLLLTLVATFAATAQIGWGASICAAGTLTNYIALGTGGCTIGIDTVSNFQTLSGITGSTAISLNTIQVTPSGGSTNPTLTFSTTAQTAGLLEAIFSYRISGNSFTGSLVTLSNTTSTGDGSSTYIQNLCGNGVFGSNGVSGCTGPTQGPLVVVSSGSDSTTFAGPSFLTVADDFTLDGGPSGTASGGTFVDRFTATNASAVPEPGTIVATTLGFALLFTLKLRSKETL